MPCFVRESLMMKLYFILSAICIIPTLTARAQEHNFSSLRPTAMRRRVAGLCSSVTLRYEGVWASGCINPHFLDLGSSWR
jgi:hypothetical protein